VRHLLVGTFERGVGYKKRQEPAAPATHTARLVFSPNPPVGERFRDPEPGNQTHVGSGIQANPRALELGDETEKYQNEELDIG